jgi:hypothetical protein
MIQSSAVSHQKQLIFEAAQGVTTMINLQTVLAIEHKNLFCTAQTLAMLVLHL